MAGWGLTQTNGFLSDVLKEAAAPLVDDAGPADYFGLNMTTKFCTDAAGADQGTCNVMLILMHSINIYNVV